MATPSTAALTLRAMVADVAGGVAHETGVDQQTISGLVLALLGQASDVFVPVETAGTNYAYTIFVATAACKLVAVNFTPVSTVAAGGGTDKKTWTVKKGHAGTLGSALFTDDSITVGFTADTTRAFTPTTVVELAAGDIIRIDNTKAGNGFATPAGTWSVTTTPI